jgi:hypothetical protein
MGLAEELMKIKFLHLKKIDIITHQNRVGDALWVLWMMQGVHMYVNAGIRLVSFQWRQYFHALVLVMCPRLHDIVKSVCKGCAVNTSGRWSLAPIKLWPVHHKGHIWIPPPTLLNFGITLGIMSRRKWGVHRLHGTRSCRTADPRGSWKYMYNDACKRCNVKVFISQTGLGFNKLKTNCSAVRWTMGHIKSIFMVKNAYPSDT